MNKKVVVSIVVILAALVVITASQISIKAINKPADMCLAPFDWVVCQDWAIKGLVLNWGGKTDNFVSVINMEDLHIAWNGSTYDRTTQKTLMVQSSLLGELQGDCGGWIGNLCYKYSEYTDTFK